MTKKNINIYSSIQPRTPRTEEQQRKDDTMIGGNVIATVQVKTGTGKNAIGETVQEWKDLGNLLGFLDNQTSDINLQEYNALIQETTDIFICDYKRLNGMHFNAENARFIIDGLEYNILLIDDVEGRHEHLEVYLKFIGLGHTR